MMPIPIVPIVGGRRACLKLSGQILNLLFADHLASSRVTIHEIEVVRTTAGESETGRNLKP
jgi:hypothetical protein